MSESDSPNMICPKCGHFQEKAETCVSCGVVIAKAKGEQPESETKPAAGEDNTPPPGGDIFSTGDSGGESKHKFIIPLLMAGVVLIGIGLTMLGNKLTGGSLNEGAMRHLSWFLIPFLITAGAGCISQALEWIKE